ARSAAACSATSASRWATSAPRAPCPHSSRRSGTRNRSSGATPHGHWGGSEFPRRRLVSPRRLHLKRIHGCKRKWKGRFVVRYDGEVMPSLHGLFRRHVCQTSSSPLELEVVEARGATRATADGR